MSTRHVGGVLQLRLPPNLKIVAVVYADSANTEDNIVCLGIPKVAELSGYQRRQAQTLTHELVELGVLTPVTELPDSAVKRLCHIPENRLPNAYLVDYSGVQSLHPKETLGVQSRVARGAVARQSGVQLIAPKPEEEPEENQRTTIVVLPHCPKDGCDKPTHTGPHRDPWWDMIVEVLGYRDGHVPPRQRTRFGRFARYVQGRGDPPEMIRKAARGIIVAWGREKLTINSLEEHYELFTGALSDIDEGDVAAVKGALREDRARRDILAAAGGGT